MFYNDSRIGMVQGDLHKADDEDGSWITMNGTHVHMKDGEVDKGPQKVRDHVSAKNKSDASRKREATMQRLQQIVNNGGADLSPTEKSDLLAQLRQDPSLKAAYTRMVDVKVAAENRQRTQNTERSRNSYGGRSHVIGPYGAKSTWASQRARESQYHDQIVHHEPNGKTWIEY